MRSSRREGSHKMLGWRPKRSPWRSQSCRAIGRGQWPELDLDTYLLATFCGSELIFRLSDSIDSLPFVPGQHFLGASWHALNHCHPDHGEKPAVPPGALPAPASPQPSAWASHSLCWRVGGPRQRHRSTDLPQLARCNEVPAPSVLWGQSGLGFSLHLLGDRG